MSGRQHNLLVLDAVARRHVAQDNSIVHGSINSSSIARAPWFGLSQML
jgi:hypothetical protein